MAVPGCSPLLQALKAEAASESSLLFGVCGGISLEACVETLADNDNSLWRQSVRGQMATTHQQWGEQGTYLLMVCLAAGVNALTNNKYGTSKWRVVFERDRPDAAGVTPSIPHKLRPQLVYADASRVAAPLPPIDPQMMSCHAKGGTWDPVSGKCIVPGPDFPEDEEGAIEAEADVEGQCAAAGGTWDPVVQSCVMPMPPGLVEAGERAGLYLALGGLGIIALTGVGIYLAVRK